MRSIPGTITHYVQDRDQVDELDKSQAEVLSIRRAKAAARAAQAQAQADADRRIVAAYDREIEGIEV